MVEHADAVKYKWMDAKVVGTPFVMNIETPIDAADIPFRDPMDWLNLFVGLERRICNSFDDCSVMLYECLFIKIGLRLSLSEFEMVVLKHLKVSPS